MSEKGNKYRVIDNITDKKIFEGSAKQINEITGASMSRICEAARDGRTICRGRYRIIDISGDREKMTANNDMLSAAKAWDEFVTPIREYYGIPVYRPGKGVRR